MAPRRRVAAAAAAARRSRTSAGSATLAGGRWGPGVEVRPSRRSDAASECPAGAQECPCARDHRRLFKGGHGAGQHFEACKQANEKERKT